MIQLRNLSFYSGPMQPETYTVGYWAMDTIVAHQIGNGAPTLNCHNLPFVGS